MVPVFFEDLMNHFDFGRSIRDFGLGKDKLQIEILLSEFILHK